MNIKELRISQRIAAGVTIASEYTPAVGEEVVIDNFTGAYNFHKNLELCLFWDKDGDEEEIVWRVVENNNLQSKRAFTGDGVKKVRLECINNESVADDAVVANVFLKLKIPVE